MVSSVLLGTTCSVSPSHVHGVLTAGKPLFALRQTGAQHTSQ